MKRLTHFLILALTSLALASPATADGKMAAWAYADGHGTVRLFWFPGKAWPAKGWRVVRECGGKRVALAEGLYPGKDTAAMKSLAPDDARAIRELAKKAKKMGKEEAAFSIALFGIKAMESIPFGRALGVRYTDKHPGSGTCRYTVEAVGRNGRAFERAATPGVDASKASPPPASCTRLEVESLAEGVGIRWMRPDFDKRRPVVGYALERVDPDGKRVEVTRGTLVVADTVFKGHKPIVTDTSAPLEEEVTYRLYAVGLFGERSKAVVKKIYLDDPAALQPPTLVAAENGKERVELTWRPNPSPHCAGYVIERSLLRNGPFEALTPRGLPADRKNYTDKDVRPGTSYFYRLRAINRRGRTGVPSLVAKAQPVGPRPPRVEGLEADAGVSMVKLCWKPPKKEVSGYMVYRRVKGSEKWVQLNNRAVRATCYEDLYDPTKTWGTYLYRVAAVGYDNRVGRPSREVAVTLVDRISPNPPVITGIDGSDGRAVVRFEPAPPLEDIAAFYLVRSVSPDDPGLVVGDALSKRARKATDTFVKQGVRYWYRMVAVDRAGNRSDPSPAVTVVIQNPPIPRPSRPKAVYKAAPIPHVLVHVAKIPARMTAVVERQRAGEKAWRPVAETTQAGEVADMRLPQNAKTLRYRLRFRAENGAKGAPSKEVAVEMK